MDGTLYYQLPLRIIMFFELIFYYLINPLKIHELKIISYYRKSRNMNSEELDNNKIIKNVSHHFMVSDKEIQNLVYKWFVVRPKKYLKFFLKKGIIDFLTKLKNKKINLTVYSDYPATEKINSMDISSFFKIPDCHENIEKLKPDIKRLNNILEFFQIEKSKILYIGDDSFKDGKSAKKLGISFIKISKSKKNTYDFKSYKNIKVI